MKTRLFSTRRFRFLTVGAIVLVIGVSAWALGGRALFASAVKTVTKPKAEARFIQPQGGPRAGAGTQVTHVAVYDAGTYPREIRVPAGTVRLMIEDYSTQGGDFQVAPLASNPVERLTAAAPSAMTLPVGERRGELTLTLTAGEHRFGRGGQSPESRLRIIAE